MMKLLRRFGRWVMDVVLLRPYEIEPAPEIEPDPPPWDVPLDQTIAGVRWEDERERYERAKAERELRSTSGVSKGGGL
jgi:hypothetical protein